MSGRLLFSFFGRIHFNVYFLSLASQIGQTQKKLKITVLAISTEITKLVCAILALNVRPYVHTQCWSKK